MKKLLLRQSLWLNWDRKKSHFSKPLKNFAGEHSTRRSLCDMFVPNFSLPDFLFFPASGENRTNT